MRKYTVYVQWYKRDKWHVYQDYDGRYRFPLAHARGVMALVSKTTVNDESHPRYPWGACVISDTGTVYAATALPLRPDEYGQPRYQYQFPTTQQEVA
jgi:hypothetical protein